MYHENPKPWTKPFDPGNNLASNYNPGNVTIINQEFIDQYIIRSECVICNKMKDDVCSDCKMGRHPSGDPIKGTKHYNHYRAETIIENVEFKYKIKLNFSNMFFCFYYNIPFILRTGIFLQFVIHHVNGNSNDYSKGNLVAIPIKIHDSIGSKISHRKRKIISLEENYKINPSKELLSEINTIKTDLVNINITDNHPFIKVFIEEFGSLVKNNMI